MVRICYSFSLIQLIVNRLLGGISAAMNASMRRHRKGQPSKWVIFGIIFGIISFAIAFVVVCVLLRFHRQSNKDKVAADP